MAGLARLRSAHPAEDGSERLLVDLADGQTVESVLLPRDGLCVSSQVGCTLNCRFCHTGTMRLVRNLGAGEIVGQVLLARDALGEWPKGNMASMADVDDEDDDAGHYTSDGRMLTNIVMMGMGEPLYNFDEVKGALKIVMDGMKCAMDLRLLDPSLPDEETSKLNACVRNVYELWARGAERRTTQIIFSDIGVHEQHGFSVYRDICAKLMGRGVPEREIAIAQDFNTDAKVAQLDRKINAGEVRIVLGSTAVLGIGRNVQRRLCALHHLDAPYRADEVEQRDGRAIRQGNTCSEVAIYRYVTAGTFDAFKWQTVERKARFVGQFRRHNGTERVIEDIDAGLLSFAEVKALASGNPLARDAVLLQSQERRLAASARDATARLRQLRWKHESLSGVLERAIASLADVERVTSRLVPLDADGFGCSAADGRALSLPDFLAAACHQAAVCRLGGEINTPLVGTYGGAAVRVAQNGYGFNMSLLGLADAYVVEPIRISAYAPDSIAKALARAYQELAETPQQVGEFVAEHSTKVRI